jgi:hypothetical protein
VSPSLALRQPTYARRGPQRPVREATLIWTLPALVRWGSVVTLSAIACVGSWYSISGERVWANQIPAMNVAIISVVLANAASIGLLLAGRRAIGLRRQALLGEPAEVARERASAQPANHAVGALVGGPGLLHFHRADCAMAAGRGWAAASAVNHGRAGRTACGVCRP